MQATAISIAVVLALSGAATLSADDEDQLTNEDWFEGRFGDQWDPDLEATLHTSAGETEITLGEAAELFGERAQGFDLHSVSQADEPVEGVATAGSEIWIIEEALGTDLSVGCAQDTGGEGGHSTIAIDNPAPQEDPFLRLPFYGAATSDISTEGQGIVVNFSTGEEWLYNGQVAYTGNSDFWCLEATLFGQEYVLNFPYLDGAFVGPV